jgi:hypothetical protein
MYPIPLCMLIAHVGDWTIRTDSPHGNVPNAQKHVHVKKRGVSGEYSWNIDGSRHDASRFPYSEQCIKAAKQHAASALGVSVASLNLVVAVPGGRRISLRSGQPWEADGMVIFNSYVRKHVLLAVFEHERGSVIVLSSDS